MKKTILILSVVFATILLTTVSYYKNQLIPMEKYKNDKAILQEELLTYIKNINIETSDSLIFTDQYRRIWKKDKITNKKRIGIYYDNHQCYDCIDKAVSFLEAKTKELKIDSPFILTNSAYYSIRDLKILQNDSKYPVYSIDISKYPTLRDVVSRRAPFYFILDAHNRISSVYFPNRPLNNIIGDDYFKYVKKVIDNN